MVVHTYQVQNVQANINQKGGGNVDVSVKNKGLWPREAILGGVNRQRVTYDQLSLTQWVQIFCKNILEEKSSQRRDIMVSYLGDLMKDATDFTWQGAKAAHAVLMCEMERGSLQWEDMDRIDRIRRAHAQKHAPGNGGWAKPSDVGRKPWFCKNFQSGNCSHTRNHDFNGKLQKHISGNNWVMQKKTAFSRNKTQKMTKQLPSLGWDSCSSGSQYKVQVNACKSSVKADASHIFEKPRKHECKSSNVKHYRTRFFYNSSVKPKVIEASLARKSSDSITHVKMLSRPGVLT